MNTLFRSYINHDSPDNLASVLQNEEYPESVAGRQACLVQKRADCNS